jgi:hypothetical protein
MNLTGSIMKCEFHDLIMNGSQRNTAPIVPMNENRSRLRQMPRQGVQQLFDLELPEIINKLDNADIKPRARLREHLHAAI